LPYVMERLTWKAESLEHHLQTARHPGVVEWLPIRPGKDEASILIDSGCPHPLFELPRPMLPEGRDGEPG